MKVLLTAINAKYPHTNPAVRSIAAFAGERINGKISILEFTVNQKADDILSRLFEAQGDVCLFSCYIWNVELIKIVAGELRKLRPELLLGAGGPEVSWRSDVFLEDNPAFDLVIRGEGEETVAALLAGLESGGLPQALPGVTFRLADGSIRKNPAAAPVEPDRLPFPYPDLERLGNRVLYYESMRGCPFSCSYCISSLGQGVRFRSLETVFAHLTKFLAAGVPRVKFVDRTFNCNRDHALAVWRFLMEQDNGVTNFHFELAGDLLDDDTLELLSAARPGLFQFEVGVQSTNPETLREIRRPAGLDRLFHAVRRLREGGNIHLHLDLIAGLPLEDFHSFARSFNQVFALRPEQLQLGFLKVLRGSVMEANAEAYGLEYRSHAPYEILCNRWLSYARLLELKGVEEMLELYYNSGRFVRLTEDLCRRFETPFDFFRSLARFWRERGLDEAPPDKTGCWQVQGDFMVHCGFPVTEREQWLCRYDMARHDKIRKLPPWVEVDGTQPWRRQISQFYHNRASMEGFLPHLRALPPRTAAARTHLERFPFDPGGSSDRPLFLLFDYTRRDVSGLARVQIVPDRLLTGDHPSSPAGHGG